MAVGYTASYFFRISLSKSYDVSISFVKTLPHSRQLIDLLTVGLLGQSDTCSLNGKFYNIMLKVNNNCREVVKSE